MTQPPIPPTDAVPKEASPDENARELLSQAREIQLKGNTEIDDRLVLGTQTTGCGVRPTCPPPGEPHSLGDGLRGDGESHHAEGEENVLGRHVEPGEQTRSERGLNRLDEIGRAS